MPASLRNTNISDTYLGVLHSFGNALPGTGQQDIYDGIGNKSSLKLGRNCNGATICGTLSCDNLFVTNASSSFPQLTIQGPEPTLFFVETDTSPNNRWQMTMNNDTLNFYNTGNTGVKQLVVSKTNGIFVNTGLTVYGTASATSFTGQTFTSTSSIKYKKDIQPLEDALEMVKKLEGVRFTWKDNEKQDLGVIAEEVNRVVPEIVLKDENNDPSGVDYGKLTAILIEAVKELAKRIN